LLTLSIDQPFSLLVRNVTIKEPYSLFHNRSFRMLGSERANEEVLMTNHSPCFRFGLTDESDANSSNPIGDFFFAVSALAAWRTTPSVANTMLFLFSGPFATMGATEAEPIRLVHSYMTQRFLLSEENKTAFILLPSTAVNASAKRSRDELVQQRVETSKQSTQKRIIAAVAGALDYTIIRVLSTSEAHLRRLTHVVGTPSPLPRYGPQTLSLADFRVVNNTSSDEMPVALYFGHAGCCIPEALDWGLALEWQESEPGHSGSV
jgi:hypothetical protein